MPYLCFGFQVLDYMKLLIVRQEGNMDLTDSTIQKYFPVIDTPVRQVNKIKRATDTYIENTSVQKSKSFRYTYRSMVLSLKA